MATWTSVGSHLSKFLVIIAISKRLERNLIVLCHRHQDDFSSEFAAILLDVLLTLRVFYQDNLALDQTLGAARPSLGIGRKAAVIWSSHCHIVLLVVPATFGKVHCLLGARVCQSKCAEFLDHKFL